MKHIPLEHVVYPSERVCACTWGRERGKGYRELAGRSVPILEPACEVHPRCEYMRSHIHAPEDKAAWETKYIEDLGPETFTIMGRARTVDGWGDTPPFREVSDITIKRFLREQEDKRKVEEARKPVTRPCTRCNREFEALNLRYTLCPACKDQDKRLRGFGEPQIFTVDCRACGKEYDTTDRRIKYCRSCLMIRAV